MEQYFSVLEACPLFEKIERTDLPGLLGCLGARVVNRRKNQVIFAEGDPATHVGIVLRGSAQILREDYFGNRSIVAHVDVAELFAESFACAGIAALPVSVVAAEDGEFMIIECSRITVSCSNCCSFHNQMVFNMLKVVASNNLVFNQKIEITSKRTTREKLMTYLLSQAKQKGSNSFAIPYDRQALADYLEVERSAMSAEISKLRKEGILESNRNQFTLL